MDKDKEAGFSIVEVMVATVLVLAVSLSLLSFLDSTTSATARAGANVEAEREAQIVLRTLGQDIRSAESIATVYPGSPVCPTGVTFTSSPFAGFQNCISIRIARPVAGDTCPYTEAVYGLAGGVLRTNRTEYRFASGTCSAVVSTTAKVVMSDVVNPAASPLFTYYDRTGKALTGASSPSAASVKITLVKRYRRLNAPDLTLSSVVALRNTR